MSNEKTWKKLLAPWGEQYARLDHDLRQHCEQLSDDDLLALQNASRRPTRTNCGWDVYRVAHIVWEATREVQQDRRKALGQ
jgi:hypothetical protein